MVAGRKQRCYGQVGEFNGACFVAGTLVHTDKGLVPIQNIMVGDVVLSKHESGSGFIEYKKVTKTFSKANQNFLALCYITCSFENESDPGNFSIELLTGDHPVWIKSIDEDDEVDKITLGWTAAQDLPQGLWVNFEYKNEVDGYLETVRNVYGTADSEVFWVAGYDSPEYLISLREGRIEYYYIYHLFSYGRGQRSADMPSFGNRIKIGNLHMPIVNEFYENYKFRKADFIAQQNVYNIEVESYHTYFVGEYGLWVHNTRAC